MLVAPNILVDIVCRYSALKMVNIKRPIKPSNVNSEYLQFHHRHTVTTRKRTATSKSVEMLPVSSP